MRLKNNARCSPCQDAKYTDMKSECKENWNTLQSHYRTWLNDIINPVSTPPLLLPDLANRQLPCCGLIPLVQRRHISHCSCRAVFVLFEGLEPFTAYIIHSHEFKKIATASNKANFKTTMVQNSKTVRKTLNITFWSGLRWYEIMTKYPIIKYRVVILETLASKYWSWVCQEMTRTLQPSIQIHWGRGFNVTKGMTQKVFLKSNCFPKKVLRNEPGTYV